MTRIEDILAELRAAGEIIARHPAAVANRLRLSLQVPVRLIYLTSGPSRRLHFGKQIVELRHDPKLKERPKLTRAPTKKEIHDLAEDVVGSTEFALA